MDVNELPTPALIVDVEAFDHNVAAMAAVLPGTKLRPHVKAFKSTALAHELAVNGHTGFCCATPREVEGMARAMGLGVRGVMGYEGHLMMEFDDQASKVERAMAKLLAAHADVGGDIVSGGGTGTYQVNRWVTEIQAGSYTLMDSDYGRRDLPFRQALHVLGTVVSTNPGSRKMPPYAVADVGLKSLSLDHGNPTVVGGDIWFCSDEHTTFAAAEGHDLPKVGDRVRIIPSHVDPTVNLHEVLTVIRDDEVVDRWAVDLRGW